MRLLFNSATAKRHIEKKDNYESDEEMQFLATDKSKFFHSIPDARLTFGDKIIGGRAEVLEGGKVRAINIDTFAKLIYQCLQNKMNRILSMYYKDQYRYIYSAIAFVYNERIYVFTYGRKAVQFELQVKTNLGVNAVYDHMSFADNRIMELYEDDNKLVIALESHIEATFLHSYITPAVFDKEMSCLRNWRPVF